MNTKKKTNENVKRAKRTSFRITRKTRTNGTVQWEVYCGRQAGKRVRKYFGTREEAETYREQAKTQKANHGIAALAMPESVRLEALTCFERLRDICATLTQATEYFLLHAHPATDVPTFSDVAAELVQSKVRLKKKKSYTDGLAWTFGVFNRSFGARKLNDLSAKEIEDWVWDMDYAHSTVRGYLRDVGQVFRYAVKRHYCLENPCAVIDKPEDEDKEKPTIIFTPAQTARVLNEAGRHTDLELIVPFALAFFAGLRSSELELLDWAEIYLDRRFIEVQNAKPRRGSGG